MKLNLESVALPLERFTFTADRTLVAELSDFNLKYLAMHRIYDDACDVGIAIRSHHTGKVEIFYFDNEDRSADGEDIAGYNFKPVNQNCKVKNVLLIND